MFRFEGHSKSYECLESFTTAAAESLIFHFLRASLTLIASCYGHMLIISKTIKCVTKLTIKPRVLSIIRFLNSKSLTYQNFQTNKPGLC